MDEKNKKKKESEEEKTFFFYLEGVGKVISMPMKIVIKYLPKNAEGTQEFKPPKSRRNSSY